MVMGDSKRTCPIAIMPLCRNPVGITRIKVVIRKKYNNQYPICNKMIADFFTSWNYPFSFLVI